MAKQMRGEFVDVGVLLTLKSELWQSCEKFACNLVEVLLTLKSELWQSLRKLYGQRLVVLLTLKSELWQSDDFQLVLVGQFCLP